MRKFLIAFFGLICLHAKSQTLDEVIQRFTAAMGGSEAFNAIKTVKLTGTFTVQGRNLPITIQIITGKAFRSDIDLEGKMVTNVYNDGKGWRTDSRSASATPVELSGTELSDLKAQSYIVHPLMEHKSRGVAELIGKDTVNGVETFKIKFTNKDGGRVTIYFISARDYQLIKSLTDRVVQGETMESETWYSDITEIAGAKFYRSRQNKVLGQIYQSIKYDKIELNIPIDEKIFRKE